MQNHILKGPFKPKKVLFALTDMTESLSGFSLRPYFSFKARVILSAWDLASPMQ